MGARRRRGRRGGGRRGEGRDGEEEGRGGGEEVGLQRARALRWRLCHKRALQRAYRAAAARLEEAIEVAEEEGGGGGGRGREEVWLSRRAIVTFRWNGFIYATK